MNSRALRLALLPLGIACAVGARAQAPLPKDAFVPPSSPGAANTGSDAIEFVGATSIGKNTSLTFQDKNTKKKSVVQLGGPAIDGIQVVSYDTDKDQAVVKIGGAQKTLALRKGTGPVGAPNSVPVMQTGFATPAPAPTPATPAIVTMPAPAPAAGQPGAAPTAPATPATPETIAKQEQEARMLVSDLLEIGMAQRKAYEDAQRKMQDTSGQSTPTAQPGAVPPSVPVAPVPAPAPAK